MDPIWDYLVDGTLPGVSSEAAALKRRALSFVMHKGELFQKGYLQPLFKCVTQKGERKYWKICMPASVDHTLAERLLPKEPGGRDTFGPLSRQMH